MEKRRKRKEARKSMALGFTPHHPTTSLSSSQQPKQKSQKSKALKPDEKIPEITFEMKKEISENINNLGQDQIITVFQIIREGIPSLGAVNLIYILLFSSFILTNHYPHNHYPHIYHIYLYQSISSRHILIMILITVEG